MGTYKSPIASDAMQHLVQTEEYNFSFTYSLGFKIDMESLNAEFNEGGDDVSIAGLISRTQDDAAQAIADALRASLDGDEMFAAFGGKDLQSSVAAADEYADAFTVNISNEVILVFFRNPDDPGGGVQGKVDAAQKGLGDALAAAGSDLEINNASPAAPEITVQVSSVSS